MVKFNSEVSLLSFYLNDISIDEIWVLNSPSVIVSGCIGPFLSSSVCLLSWMQQCLGHVKLQLLYLLDGLFHLFTIQ
jgi:hypothetical protein